MNVRLIASPDLQNKLGKNVGAVNAFVVSEKTNEGLQGRLLDLHILGERVGRPFPAFLFHPLIKYEVNVDVAKFVDELGVGLVVLIKKFVNLKA